MYRAAASRLRGLEGHVLNNLPARHSSSSSVAARSSTGGLFSWLIGGRPGPLPPLNFALQDVTLPPPLPDHVEPSKTEITTLHNGLKIASETSQSPTASIGIYINCGSIYERPDICGVSHLLERMAFKTTLNRTHFRIVREVEAIGGNVNATASREQMCYTFDAMKTNVPEMVELLIDCVRNPAFLDWEVKEQLQNVKEQIAQSFNNPQGLLMEAIHSAGYDGALKNPLLAPESSLSRLDGTMLEEFVAENYTAPRMVLAASGVEHGELVSFAKPLLDDVPDPTSETQMPGVPYPPEPESGYIGGDYRCQADTEKTHFALAFGLPGGWRQDKDAVTLTVLQMLMGGGGSFSAGGPGKGMYSRLYLRVLNEHQQVQSFTAFINIYNDSSLFGIQATTRFDFVPEAIDIAVKELLAITKPGEVDSVQLHRAKQSTKASILMNLESRAVVSEDIGRQILTYGERKSVEHFLNTVDAVTPNDIASIAQKLVSSPLTMASYGNICYVPSYDSVSRRFRLK